MSGVPAAQVLTGADAGPTCQGLAINAAGDGGILIFSVWGGPVLTHLVWPPDDTAVHTPTLGLINPSDTVLES